MLPSASEPKLLRYMDPPYMSEDASELAWAASWAAVRSMELSSAPVASRWRSVEVMKLSAY